MVDDVVQQVKDRLNIVDVVGGYVRLSKSGINHKGLCPFHSEKTPSFMVNEERQIFHCFGCDEGGDVLSFIQKIEAMSFPEALRLLAERAGVEVPEFRQQARDTMVVDSKTRLYQLLSIAATRFVDHLQGSDGRVAKEYLLSRGLTAETIEHYLLGYSLDLWHDIDDALQKQGYTRDEIRSAGLLVLNEQGRMYDRFRGRVMFPIQDAQGRVIGFGGRVLQATDDAGAKYLNTTQTPVYNKSRVLYGIQDARLMMRKQDYVVLVEGYTDVLMSHQIGVKNVVSVSGTALTNEHLQILSRYTKNIMFAFDMDAAGQRAAKRSVVMALQEGWNVKVVQMERGLDPADAIVKDPAMWKSALKHALPVLDYYIASALEHYDISTGLGKKRVVAEVLALLRHVDSPIEQSHYVQRLSQVLSVQEDVLFEVLRQQRSHRTLSGVRKSSEETLRAPKRHDRYLELQELCLALLFGKHDQLELSEFRLDLFVDERWSSVIDALEQSQDFDIPRVFHRLSRELQNELNCAIVKAEHLLDQSGATPHEEFSRCYSELVRLSLQKSLQQTQHELRQAEERKDEAAVARSTTKLQELLEELRLVT